MSPQTELKEVNCKIVDATVEDNSQSQNENLRDDESPRFEQRVILLLKELESGMLFQSVLPESDVRQLLGIRRPLSSKEMINFATYLRSRVDPVRLMVDPREQEVTPDMLLASNKKKKEKSDQVDDKEIDLTQVPSRQANTRQFAYRKQANPTQESEEE